MGKFVWCVALLCAAGVCYAQGMDNVAIADDVYAEQGPSLWNTIKSGGLIGFMILLLFQVGGILGLIVVIRVVVNKSSDMPLTMKLLPCGALMGLALGVLGFGSGLVAMNNVIGTSLAEGSIREYASGVGVSAVCLVLGALCSFGYIMAFTICLIIHELKKARLVRDQ